MCGNFMITHRMPLSSESRANHEAEADGYPQAGKLFRTAAEAETVHAPAHLRVMGVTQVTAGNLQAAIDGERFEFQEIYP